MNQDDDYQELCAFFQRSNFDLLQQHKSSGWGDVWTFDGHDIRAAQNAARQMKRMGVSRLRHACSALLPSEILCERRVVVVTEIPGRSQHVLDIATGLPLQVRELLMDDILTAVETYSGL